MMDFSKKLIKYGWITICPLSYDNVIIYDFLSPSNKKETKRERTVKKVADINNPNMNIIQLITSNVNKLNTLLN